MANDFEIQAQNGELWDRYRAYVALCVVDENGVDTTTGQPVKTFDEWLNN